MCDSQRRLLDRPCSVGVMGDSAGSRVPREVRILESGSGSLLWLHGNPGRGGYLRRHTSGWIRQAVVDERAWSRSRLLWNLDRFRRLNSTG